MNRRQSACCIVPKNDAVAERVTEHNRLADAALQKFVESIFMPEAEFRNDII